METPKILVTGGSGYIGSHTVVNLISQGFEVLIIDNLCNSESSVLKGIAAITGKEPNFHEIDMRDEVTLESFFSLNKDIDAVIHFAALKAVGESADQPVLYYQNNLVSLINLLKCIEKYNISNLIFSSSATIYGEPDSLPIKESHRLKPALSPYGNTKKICEDIIRDATKANSQLKAISLRYFNPIGAHDSGEIGEFPKGIPNNLMPYITQTAAGIRKELLVFGNDYSTPDGTAIRDYIHVVDLAEAHVKALKRVFQKKQKTNYEVFNLGTGKGYSVLEVIKSFEKMSGRKLPYRIVDRRPGDVEQTYASIELANQELGWRVQKNLDDMTSSAWKWELRLREKSKKGVVVHAPGRINIIGEHTDYNNGLVLPAAIDKKLSVHIVPNGTKSLVNIDAQDFNTCFSFDLDNFQPVSENWPNYIMGVVHELQKLGARIEGFDAEFGSTIPIGSGLSSSAALECGFAVALNKLFNQGLDEWQLIKASQRAEHNFVGAKCGIMDQFASVMGKEDQVMLLDCQSLEYQYFPLNLGDFRILLLNSNVSHSLASSEYNTRRAECETGVSILQNIYPGIKSLRDVSLNQLLQCKEELPEYIFRRCHHVVSENKRVLDAVEALKKGDHQLLGQLIFQSHFSLQNDYGVSCPELDFLVQQAQDKDYVLGSRMIGGGFGGCTLNIVHESKMEEFIENVTQKYKEHFGIDLTPIEVAIANGVKVIYY